MHGGGAWNLFDVQAPTDCPSGHNYRAKGLPKWYQCAHEQSFSRHESLADWDGLLPAAQSTSAGGGIGPG